MTSSNVIYTVKTTPSKVSQPISTSATQAEQHLVPVTSSANASLMSMKRMHPTSDLVPSQGYAESQVVRPGLKTILPQVGLHHGQGVTPLFVQHTDVICTNYLVYYLKCLKVLSFRVLLHTNIWFIKRGLTLEK